MDAPLRAHWPKLLLWGAEEGVLLALTLVVQGGRGAMAWDPSIPDCRQQDWTCKFSRGWGRRPLGGALAAPLGARLWVGVLAPRRQILCSAAAPLPACTPARLGAAAAITLVSLNAAFIVAYFLFWLANMCRAFANLASLPYASYRMGNLLIRLQARLAAGGCQLGWMAGQLAGAAGVPEHTRARLACSGACVPEVGNLAPLPQVRLRGASIVFFVLCIICYTFGAAFFPTPLHRPACIALPAGASVRPAPRRRTRPCPSPPPLLAVKLNTCSSYIISWLGYLPMQLVSGGRGLGAAGLAVWAARSVAPGARRQRWQGSSCRTGPAWCVFSCPQVASATAIANGYMCMPKRPHEFGILQVASAGRGSEGQPGHPLDGPAWPAAAQPRPAGPHLLHPLPCRPGSPSLRGPRRTHRASGASAPPPCPRSRSSTFASTGALRKAEGQGSGHGWLSAAACAAVQADADGDLPHLPPWCSEPMFVFETAVKMLYWAFLVKNIPPTPAAAHAPAPWQRYALTLLPTAAAAAPYPRPPTHPGVRPPGAPRLHLPPRGRPAAVRPGAL